MVQLKPKRSPGTWLMIALQRHLVERDPRIGGLETRTNGLAGKQGRDGCLGLSVVSGREEVVQRIV